MSMEQTDQFKNRILSSWTFHRLNSNGQSIVQALVGVAIMGITMLSFMTMQIAQQKETRALNEKMDVLSLKSLLINTLGDGKVCSFELQNAAKKTFNMKSPNAFKEVKIPIKHFHLKNKLTSPLIVEVSNTVPAVPGSTSLFVKSIELTNLKGSGEDYTAEWIISFDESKLVRSLKSISIPTMITVDIANPVAAKIISCGDEQVDSGESNGIDIIKGKDPECPKGKAMLSRKWTTSGCSNFGNFCNLYRGWSGAPPSCESMLDWEKSHICYAKNWDAVQCM